MQYRADIQGLRAIAVALVVLVHAGVPGFTGGYIGVDVFFVLSGYLITGLLVNEHASAGRIHYLGFLTRRLKRLLPAMLAVLLTIGAVAPLLLSAYETRMQTGSFPFAATWTSNFFFAFAEFDYFAALKQKDLFLHTWSLGIEEQFYIVWPWLILAAFLGAGKPGAAAVPVNRLLALFAGVFVASLLLCLYWARAEPLLGFYMMPARGWQFALGAIVFLILHPLPAARGEGFAARLAALRVPAGTVGLGLIIGSAILLDAELTYPGYYALFPSCGAAAVIFAGTAGSPPGPNKVLAMRPFVWLGDRSYSLYLWHWPVLLLGDAYGLTSMPLGVVLLITLSVALSSLSYKFIELPFWKGRLSSPRPAPTIVAAGLAMIVSVYAIHEYRDQTAGGPAVARGTASYDPRTDAPAIYTAGFDCDTHASSAEVEPCGSGSADAPRTAVLLGDSIGAQWVSVLPEIYVPPDWQVLVLTKSSCVMLDERLYYERIGAIYEVCEQWRNASLDYIAELAPDVVFVGMSSNYQFSESQWVEGLARVLARLSSAADNIVVIPGTPTLSFDGPSCIEQPYRFSFRLVDSRRECEERMSRDQTVVITRLLETAVARFENVQLMDLNDLVCPNRRCAAQREDGLVVFRDHQHLTDSFVVSQIPEVRRRLAAMGLAPGHAQTAVQRSSD